MTLEEKVREAIDGMQTPDVIDMWNEYRMTSSMTCRILTKLWNMKAHGE